ncbi:MAG TPA: hypothetical protein VJ742_12955 [Nitrososphaera sp.]|nr:hypothetical protein [Nitrososphaera sp.]
MNDADLEKYLARVEVEEVPFGETLWGAFRRWFVGRMNGIDMELEEEEEEQPTAQLDLENVRWCYKCRDRFPHLPKPHDPSGQVVCSNCNENHVKLGT